MKDHSEVVCFHDPSLQEFTDEANPAVRMRLREVATRLAAHARQSADDALPDTASARWTRMAEFIEEAAAEPATRELQAERLITRAINLTLAAAENKIAHLDPGFYHAIVTYGEANLLAARISVSASERDTSPEEWVELRSEIAAAVDYLLDQIPDPAVTKRVPPLQAA